MTVRNPMPLSEHFFLYLYWPDNFAVLLGKVLPGGSQWYGAAEYLKGNILRMCIMKHVLLSPSCRRMFLVCSLMLIIPVSQWSVHRVLFCPGRG